ncbi:polyphosphate--glucose phosphotransferase [Marivirga sp.]|uniref:polyphosphate--glucose phosphotransferase n=1 Tax=Marivirga sp. TaxID=2018662 RepID=UPI002D80CE05|nr:ROK family protein [Marivirga sp.]HET8860826.1 ROK family protein [Marivirga sp.]
MEVLGIDIGGSGMKAAIVDLENGEFISERKRFQTPKPATPEAMMETVIQLQNHFDWSGSIGCGFPAAIIDGIVKTASNIDKSWIEKPLANMIKKATGCDTRVMNDVDVAGLAEMRFGAGKGLKGTILVLALGSGIGSALFHNQQLMPNTELGHIQFRGDKAEASVANSIREKEDLSWEVWGKRLNSYLVEVHKLVWPDLIIIGGGVSKKFQNYQKFIDENLKVIPAELRNHAGIVGAASQFL